MKVLVIGSGAREHALAWKLAQSARVHKVVLAPGNAGTVDDDRFESWADVATDFLKNPALASELAERAARENIGLTVVGPEAPLAAGIVDAFLARGLRIFGPTKAAARLESSKDFAKAFMKRHGIPTAAYETFHDASAAHAYVEAQGVPIVIKADGLAAGKGVVVAETLDQAHAAIDDMFGANNLGVVYNPGGARVVIEDFMSGEEASFIVLADGQTACALASSQDHKRLLDGDLGPNTGGMGAYSPAPVVTPAVHARVMREIVQPTLKGMAAEGYPFVGFLYVGLMIDAQGAPRVVEFNARMGDPETEVILPRLKSDLVEALLAVTDGKADSLELEWDRRTALGVVLAADGYPAAPRKGDVIEGIPAETTDAMTFHAATRLEPNGQVTAQGGRVLCVVGLGDSVKSAQAKAYAVVNQIRMPGVQFRRDIGHRALARAQGAH